MVTLNFDPSRGYSPAEISEMLDIKIQKLERWRMVGRRNDGPAFTKLGRSVIYRGCDVIDWLEANTVPSATVSDAA